MSLRFKSIKELESSLGRKVSIEGKPAEFLSPSLKENKTNKTENQKKQIKEGNQRPFKKLWEAICIAFPEHKVVEEYKGAVPGRKFRIDIAFPDQKLALELDGWQYHGMHKQGFITDRIRQNLLTVNGWRILRFTAGQVYQELPSCVDMVRKALRVENEPHS